MTDDLIIGDLIIPAKELEERFDTSGGPGGQHANRSQTAVTIRFRVGTSSLPPDIRSKLSDRLGDLVEASAGDSRSQSRNRQLARERLADRISSALAEPKKRRRTKPTSTSRERRLAAKAARSQTKQDRRPPSDD